jgi:hypothetical protein
MEDDLDLIGRRGRRALGETGRRCTATSKSTGERCRKAPIKGGHVCQDHGGSAPQVRRTARERLQALVDPTMDALLRALGSAPPCEACGRSDADRDPVVIRAAQIVLNRCGFGPAATLTVTEAPRGASVERWLTDEQLDRMNEWYEDAKRLMLRSGALEGEVASDVQGPLPVLDVAATRPED